MDKIFVEEILVFYFFDRWEFHYNLDDEVEGKNIRVDFRVVLVLFENFVYRERAFLCFLWTCSFFSA
jgi:hypothetical protein